MKHEKLLKICVYSKLLLKENNEADFFDNFFQKNVADESAQLLANTKVVRISLQF